MSLAAMMTDTVTIVRAAVVTSARYGNRSRTDRDWTAATRTPSAAAVQPGTAGETDAAERDTVTTGIRIYLPIGADVTATDRIEWDGRSYEIVGEPQRFRPPRGRLTAHTRIIAQQVKG